MRILAGRKFARILTRIFHGDAKFLWRAVRRHRQCSIPGQSAPCSGERQQAGADTSTRWRSRPLLAMSETEIRSNATPAQRQQLLHGRGHRNLPVEDCLFPGRASRRHLGLPEETTAQRLLDHGLRPGKILPASAFHQCAVLARQAKEFLHDRPQRGHAFAAARRARQRARRPTGRRRREIME